MPSLVALLLFGPLAHASDPESIEDVEPAFSHEIRLADERLRALADTWTRQGGDVIHDPVVSAWMRRYREAQYRVAVTEGERDIKRDAMREAEQRARDTAYAVERCAVRQQGTIDELAQRDAELAREVAGLVSALDAESGLDARTAAKALTRWWTLWRQLDWAEALARHDGLDVLHQSGAELARAGAAVPSLHARFGSMLAQAEAIEGLQVERRDEQERCSALDAGPAQAEGARLRGELRTLDERVAQATATLAALEVERPADTLSDATPFLREARTVAAAYSDAVARLDTEPGRISHDLWCRVHVNGAMAMLYAGDYQTEALLRSAAAAWPDGCKGAAEVWSDQPLFQQQLARTLSGQMRIQAAALWIYFPSNGGRWRIDGQAVEGSGWEKMEPSPGPHRLEFVTPTGRLLHQYVELEGGYSYGVVADDVAIQLRDAPASEATPVVSTGVGAEGARNSDVGAWILPEDRRREVSDEILVSDWSVSVSSAWVRTVLADYFGGGIEVRREILSREHVRLELGFVQEVARADLDHHYTEGFVAPLLLRESVTFALSRPLGSASGGDHLLRPRAELTVGTVPFNAVVFGARAGLDVAVTRRGYIHLIGQGDRPRWGDGFTPALEALDGAMLWELGLHVGYGVHL